MSRTFLYECKKMLWLRRGGAAIALFFLVSAALLLLGDTPQNQAAETHRASYEFYLNRVEGPCTSETEKFLAEEAAALAGARQELQTLTDGYYAGEVPEEEYQAGAARLRAVLAHDEGFAVLYEQFLYLHENPQNRFFLATNGWQGLLGGGALNFLLLALLLFLAVPVLCEEYASRMDALLLTAAGGRRAMREKPALVFVVVTGGCLGYFALRLGFYGFKYGLPRGDFPLQSLPYYGTAEKSLSLWGAFGLLCALQWFGCLFFSALALAAAALTKKYAPAAFLSLAAVLLPYLGLRETLYYRLPLPLPYLLGVRFLKGSEVATDFLTGERATVFEELSPAALAGGWAASGLLCGLGALLLLRRHKNQWDAPRRKKSALAALCLAALCLAGCGQAQPADAVFYNLSTAEAYEQPGFRCYYDIETDRLLLEKAGGEAPQPLARSPLDALAPPRLWPLFFGAGDKVYYMRQDTDGFVDRVGQFSSTVETVSVVEVDTAGFAEKTVFRQNVSEGRSYLGAELPAGGGWEFLMGCSGFFLNRDSLFFVEDALHRIDRQTGRATVLPLPTDGNLAFDGRFLYYIGEGSLLTRYDPATQDSTPLGDVAASDFYLTAQGIFYLNRRDGDTVYLCDPEGRNSRKILDFSAASLVCRQGMIYLHGKDDSTLYRARMDGGGLEQAP